jgi:hypothetical protein
MCTYVKVQWLLDHEHAEIAAALVNHLIRYQLDN